MLNNLCNFFMLHVTVYKQQALRMFSNKALT